MVCTLYAPARNHVVFTSITAGARSKPSAGDGRPPCWGGVCVWGGGCWHLGAVFISLCEWYVVECLACHGCAGLSLQVLHGTDCHTLPPMARRHATLRVLLTDA
jgi:hypothetical protein